MFNRKKMISLLALIAFVFEGCSRAVTPTGPGSIDPNAGEKTLQTQITALICLQEGDADTDGDGICDGDDVSEEGYDCSQDANCIKPGMDDGLAKPEKSKWWLYVGGGLILAGGATLIAKAATGDWWWNEIGEDHSDANDTNNLVKFYKQFNTSIDANSTEEFFSIGGETTPHGLMTTSMNADPAQGKWYYSLSPFDGPRIKRGSEVKTCLHGELGVQYQGSEGAVHRAKVTYYLDENYLKTPKQEDMTSQAVDTLCRSKKGYFLSYQTGDADAYYVTPIPSSLITTLNSESATAFSILYKFDSLPATVNSGSSIAYCRINPDAPALTCASSDPKVSMKHVLGFENQTAIDAYNGCANNQCRVEKIFALTTGSQIKAEALPAEMQARETAISSEIPQMSEQEIEDMFVEGTKGL